MIFLLLLIIPIILSISHISFMSQVEENPEKINDKSFKTKVIMVDLFLSLLLGVIALSYLTAYNLILFPPDEQGV